MENEEKPTDFSQEFLDWINEEIPNWHNYYRGHILDLWKTWEAARKQYEKNG